MMDKIYYIASLDAYNTELGENRVADGSYIVSNGDIGLLLARGEVLPLASIELLGTYDEIFADAVLDAKYQTVHDYTTVITDAEGNTYQKPQRFGIMGGEAEYYAIQKAKLDVIKDEALSNVIVTTSSGKRIYADSNSRTDLLSAIISAQAAGITETMWKTPDGMVLITLQDMQEAVMLGLQEKGRIIGVTE